MTDGTELSPAQRRAVLDSDPHTGEVRAAPATLAALAGKGLAVAHGRLGAHYLNRLGLRVRAELRDGTPSAATAHEAPGGGSFTADTGDGPPAGDPEARAREVARAWAGLLEIRRVGNAGRPEPLRAPAAWERHRPLHAVALALEAAGLPASAVGAAGRRVRAGYRVVPVDRPEDVRVEWRRAAGPGPQPDAGERLDSCARVLADHGWEAVRYRGSGGVRYLLVSPAAR
ncbi:hypothetical protein [Streptomyces sp. HB2AG]|uniref:hypothetical protein n=1 Tax=Streptomyces sp. HB2AG TaxID=2983400 RepID=UPI0022AAE244|nr:hypothetical protein [Streptomyces sp. HB2AG]MCZ2523527.1 hypothetical protein [Streptomyces sp. HB2AG]